MGDKRVQIDGLPTESAISRSNILHTKSGGANKQTTVGDALDLILDESATGDTPTASNILLTKDLAGTNKTMTVQQVLDLTPAAVSPALESMTAFDDVVFADDSDSNLLKRTTIADLKSLMNLLEIESYTFGTDGHIDIGFFQIRYGAGTSNTDGTQSVVFQQPFTTACRACILQITTADVYGGLALGGTPTTTQFVIDRDSGIGGNVDFQYIAIGH